jgi:hypothetical protein
MGFLNASGILFVGSYIGKGATEAQFVETFATAGIPRAVGPVVKNYFSGKRGPRTIPALS